jgi:norsolorinic acid ketoreductase
MGVALTKVLLMRPNTTVIACIRNRSDIDKPNARAELDNLLRDPSSKLIVLAYDNNDDNSAKGLTSDLKVKHGITYLDVVIANAGSASLHMPLLTTPILAVRQDIECNCFGVIKLFQEMYWFLSQSRQRDGGKFIFNSAILGSIELLAMRQGDKPIASYGLSKAAANYAIRKIHFEHSDIIAVSIDGGFYDTDIGQDTADALGVDRPRLGPDAFAGPFLEQVSAANPVDEIQIPGTSLLIK